MFKSNSTVESYHFNTSATGNPSTQTPYLLAGDVPQLSLLMALRFIEWVVANPDGVVCLPADKHAEPFIKATHRLLDTWEHAETRHLLERHGIHNKKPSLSGLHFVQSNEFYPISPLQHNSVYHFVVEHYIEGFGLDPGKALLINSDDILLHNGRTYNEVFPDCQIDLSLRYRETRDKEEEIKKRSIFRIDDWCSQYEQKIREMRGIGFYLGTIGSDGRIACNIKGSDLFSTTRITQTNFETQADAANTLGGIEVARNRLVITIGLGTITYNPDATAIVFAAGEANADIVKTALESPMSATCPATVLQRLINGRFYLTKGSACKLEDQIEQYYKASPWDFSKTERSIIDLCVKIDKYAHHLTMDYLMDDPWCKLIPNLSLDTVTEVVSQIKTKLHRGMECEQGKVIYHTGPHHDDIMLGIMPYANRQLLSGNNEVHFAVATSGYNSVTNHFVVQTLRQCLQMMESGEVQMLLYPNFFSDGYQHKRYKDVYHFLDNCARKNEHEKQRGLCHRVIRDIIEIRHIESCNELVQCLNGIINELSESYEGSKNPSNVQLLKGRLREFEEELVWNYNGVRLDHIHHWRLKFYTEGLVPDNQSDTDTILEQFRSYRPDIISLAFDPEGSGPDTHYKVLQAIAGAIRKWSLETDLTHLRIIGYRNVWFKFHPSEATMFVPVSLNDLAIHQTAFAESYLTQVEASYPSPECDGPFSEISRRIWMKQMGQIQHVLGKNHFYESDNALIRSTHGLIYLKEMDINEFITLANELKKRSEGF